MLSCGEILGFRESLLAVGDARAQVPLRLAILATTVELDEWLDAWSEDTSQVRRSITLRRRLDDKTVTVIATLASHGFGVDPPRGAAPLKCHRSGVYRTIDLAGSLNRDDLEADPEPTVG